MSIRKPLVVLASVLATACSGAPSAVDPPPNPPDAAPERHVGAPPPLDTGVDASDASEGDVATVRDARTDAGADVVLDAAPPDVQPPIPRPDAGAYFADLGAPCPGACTFGPASGVCVSSHFLLDGWDLYGVCTIQCECNTDAGCAGKSGGGSYCVEAGWVCVPPELIGAQWVCAPPPRDAG